MGKFTTLSAVIFLVVALSFGPSPVDSLSIELLQTVNGIANVVNGVLKTVINFPFTPQTLKDRLQTLSTALDNRDFFGAVQGIRDLISSKFRFLKGLLDKSKLGQLEREMEKVNKAARNMTAIISDGMDKEMEKMDPIMISSQSPELANKIRLIVEKIRNATIRAENFRLTPDVVKSALRRIRDALDTDNVSRVIELLRGIAKSSFKSYLTGNNNMDDELATEIDEINFEVMALQMRAEEANNIRNSAGGLVRGMAPVVLPVLYAIYKFM